jgi:hypothetical protein
MKSLLDCFEKAVIVDVYAESDHQYKNKLNQTEIVFKSTNVPSYLLSHVKVYQQTFKVNCNNPSDINEARATFIGTLDCLNATFQQLSTPAFIESLYHQVRLHADNAQIRSSQGESIGYHHYKMALKDTIESFLSSNNATVKFNIGNGTLYINEKVIINSGVTSPTSLRQGLVQFLNFIPNGIHKREYKALSAKLNRSFPSGTWLNISGDKALKLSFQRLLYSSLFSCFTRLREYFSSTGDITNIIDPMLSSLTQTIDALTAQIDEACAQQALPVDYIEHIPVVANSQDLKDLVALGLGKDSVTAFYEREAPLIVFKEIADYLGAIDVHIIDLYAAEEKEEYAGQYIDEGYVDHIPLPNKVVREALNKIKTMLDSADPYFNSLFDKNRLNINVNGCSDYDHHHQTTWEREYIEVHLGVAAPLIHGEQSLRFVFDVRGK